MITTLGHWMSNAKDVKGDGGNGTALSISLDSCYVLWFSGISNNGGQFLVSANI